MLTLLVQGLGGRAIALGGIRQMRTALIKTFKIVLWMKILAETN